MTKPLKIFLGASSGFVALLVLAALVLRVLVDVNVYKPRLETAASQALGMEVRVGGRVGIGFFPGLHLGVEDLHVLNRGAELLNAREAKLAIELLPLLQAKVRIDKIALQEPRIFLERDPNGRFNYENTPAPGQTLSAWDLAELSFQDGTFRYADKQSGKEWAARDCRLVLQALRFSGGKSSELLQNLALTAELAFGEVKAGNFTTVQDLQLSVAGRKGVFELKPLTMRLFGGRGSGSLRADFSVPAPLYHLNYTLTQFRLEEFLKTMSPEKVADGALDFTANLAIRGKSAAEPRLSVDGAVSLRGRGLKLHNIDLDQKISRFESSQNFNLVDVGAVCFAGPLGLLVTKGYNFASIFQGSGGHSEIRNLVSDWQVAHGVARAKDVAMATAENRIALQGGLDFGNQRFDNLVVAVIDAKGCAIVRQKIHGTFQNPQVEKPGIIKSLTGPARNLFKEGMHLLPGMRCEEFYTGSVALPR
jgi:AsmA protein